MPRKLTRRSFFRTAAVSSALAAAVGVMSGCTHPSGEEPAPEPTVVDEGSATDVLESFSQADSAPVAQSVWELPLGCVLHPAEGTWIPVTCAGSSATPMVKGLALSSQSGKVVDVVASPVGATHNAVVYDVRCSDEAYAWVELDLVTRDWVLYAAPFSAGALTGEPQVLWQGTRDYDPAPLAVTGAMVVWQVQPSLAGEKTAESSHCYLWHLGDAQARPVVESPGRFATAPQVSGDAVVLCPRVQVGKGGTFYGISAYSASDDMQTVLDQMVMPQGVRPFRATRVGGRFMFSVEASYQSGGLLGKMGTYFGTPSQGFFRLSKEPSELGCGKGDVFVVKSTSSYVVLDLANSTYATIPSVDRCVDYGDFPARAGECSQLVTFATVKDKDTGFPSAVVVRTFAL